MPLAEGDYVLLMTSDEKTYLVEIKDHTFYTHKDFINLKDLIGKNYGEMIYGNKGEKFYILKPTLYDFIMKIERLTHRATSAFSG